MFGAALLASTARHGGDGDALFDAARRESSAERQVELLQQAALTGHAASAKMLGDLRGSGAWSEWKLFDGRRWDEGRCVKLPTICAILRAAPEVSGTVGGVTQQGEVTLYKLLPGAHILPHSGPDELPRAQRSQHMATRARTSS